jgi:amino acid transporter
VEVDTVTGPVSPEHRDPATGLAREAIGLREVLFQSITHMAPAAAVAFSIIAGAQYAGGALPLAVLIALVGCVCVAFTIGEFARYLPSAGGMYTYSARGLHPAVGFLVAWGYAFVEPLVAPVLYLIFGIVMAGTLASEFSCGICRADQWWIWSTVAALLVFILGYLGIQISTRAGTLLGLFEIAVFGAVSLWLIAKADHNTFKVFTSSAATAEGFSGLRGVFAGSIYTILAFIGFEAAAPLAEEARDPRRTIRRAVIYSAVGIGAFYVLTTYAATVFFGPSKMPGFAGFNNGDPWTGLAKIVWGGAWVLVFLAILNSAVANSNAGANATTRTWYAMGRIRLIPSVFTRIHPRWRSPYVAVFGQLIVGLGVALPLGFLFQPLPAFILIATMATAVIVLIYITVNLAAIRFFLKDHRDQFSPVRHVVVPLIGIAFFVPAFLTAMGIRAFSFVVRLSGPARFTGLVVGIWLVLGVLYLLYLNVRHPERVANTGRIFVDEPAETMAPTT